MLISIEIEGELMAGLRFLERLRILNREPDRRVAATAEEVLQSVTKYVSKILNTRQGSTVIDKNFGIPDFTSAGLSFTNDDMTSIEQELSAFIERCEPRLQHVEVHFSPDEGSNLQMVFNVKAELSFANDQIYPVHLVTRVDPLGKVTVTK